MDTEIMHEGGRRASARENQEEGDRRKDLMKSCSAAQSTERIKSVGFGLIEREQERLL
jgi:hypothetical protein